MNRAIQLLIQHRSPILLAAGVAVLVAVGVLSGVKPLQLSLTEMMIRMTIVVGLYVFIGNSGILSFGHIGFVCIGAYAGRLGYRRSELEAADAERPAELPAG